MMVCCYEIVIDNHHFGSVDRRLFAGFWLVCLHAARTAMFSIRSVVLTGCSKNGKAGEIGILSSLNNLQTKKKQC